MQFVHQSKCLVYRNFFSISVLVNALRKTPTYQCYENRDNFHLKKDPEQALSDFSEAINLAPQKRRQPY